MMETNLLKFDNLSTEFDVNILYFYFILSSEMMENISAIKVESIYSEMIWYHFIVD